jgi:metal-responsive CopG/Arc/MetJ family transcriptional regulator
MRTIAITIDDDLLARLDRLASGAGQGAPNRSRLVREALHDYLTRIEQLAEQEREAAVVHRHRDRLARQAKALVYEQAKP